MPRGVMPDHPGAAANTALMLLHSYVVKSRIDGRRTESQSWPVSFDVMVSCVFIYRKWLGSIEGTAMLYTILFSLPSATEVLAPTGAAGFQ